MSMAESVFIEIQGYNNRKTVVSAIYRPPNTDVHQFTKEFEHVLEAITSSSTDCFLTGDYNIDLLNTTNRETLGFINLLFSNRIIPVISLPTRHTDDSMTLIDNILTNQNGGHSTTGVILSDLSDHLPIFIIIGNAVKKQKKVISTRPQGALMKKE